MPVPASTATAHRIRRPRGARVHSAAPSTRSWSDHPSPRRRIRTRRPDVILDNDPDRPRLHGRYRAERHVPDATAVTAPPEPGHHPEQARHRSASAILCCPGAQRRCGGADTRTPAQSWSTLVLSEAMRPGRAHRGSAADVDGGTASWVLFYLAKHLPRQRRGVSFAEEQVTHQVCQWMALRPLEIAVRADPAGVAEAQQDGGESVRNRGAVGSQHAVTVDVHAAHLKHPREVGGILDRDLEEENLRVVRYGVDVALFSLFQNVLADIACLALVGDDVQSTLPDGLADEFSCFLIELDPVRAELGAAPHPRDERDRHDAQDEAKRDGDAVGFLEHVFRASA